MSLPKKNRLTTQDFAKIKNRAGLWSKGTYLKAKSTKNNILLSRFGFVVGSNVSKKAVERNKIKRILRDIIRKNINNIKNGFDIIMITNPLINKKDYLEVEKDVLDVLKNIKLIVE